ncbi:MAG: phage holin family protein [Candidatus Anstonellales archaeon]
MTEKETIYFFFILFCVDFVLGIWASIKNGRTIKSSIMFSGIFFKFLMFALVSFIAIFIKRQTGIDLFKMFILFGSFIEFTSISEHIKDIWNFNVFNFFYEKAKDFADVKNKIKKMNDETENNNSIDK